MSLNAGNVSPDRQYLVELRVVLDKDDGGIAVSRQVGHRLLESVG